jgi:2-C-methyl-D-erythritol 4-phosphate cytidylyltransferase
MGLDRNKVYVDLAGRPVITWALATCELSTDITHIALVHRDIDRVEVDTALADLTLTKLCATVPGGATRTGSELAGLEVARQLVDDGSLGPGDPVLIHDGARPFLTTGLIEKLIGAARLHGGAIPGFTPDCALARISADGRLTLVEAATLRRVQTPQVFRAGALLTAYDAAVAAGFDGVDTAQVLERFGPPGFRIAVVPADSRNIKITVAADLDRGEAIARSWTVTDWLPGGVSAPVSQSTRAKVDRRQHSSAWSHQLSTVRRRRSDT